MILNRYKRINNAYDNPKGFSRELVEVLEHAGQTQVIHEENRGYYKIDSNEKQIEIKPEIHNSKANSVLVNMLVRNRNRAPLKPAAINLWYDKASHSLRFLRDDSTQIRYFQDHFRFGLSHEQTAVQTITSQLSIREDKLPGGIPPPSSASAASRPAPSPRPTSWPGSFD